MESKYTSCDYGNCLHVAVTSGYVLTRPKGKEGAITVEVNACNEHKLVPGFIEKTK